MDRKPITPEEFESRMKEVKETYHEKMGDRELAHHFADDLLIDALKSLGYSKGVLVYESIPKWYA